MRQGVSSEKLLIIGIFATSLFLIQHAHYKNELKMLKDSFQICNSVLTSAQRNEVQEEWEFRNDLAEEASRDESDRF